MLTHRKQTSLRRLQENQASSSWLHQTRRRQDFWKKTSDLHRPEDVWFMMSWRRLIYVILSTSNLRRLQDVWFMTSLGRLIFGVLKTSLIYDVFKTSLKRRLCSNVVMTSIKRQKKWFFLILYCLKYSEKFKCSCLG